MGRAVSICGREPFPAIQVIFDDDDENYGIDGGYVVVIFGPALFPAIQVISQITMSSQYVYVDNEMKIC